MKQEDIEKKIQLAKQQMEQAREAFHQFAGAVNVLEQLLVEEKSKRGKKKGEQVDSEDVECDDAEGDGASLDSDVHEESKAA